MDRTAFTFWVTKYATTSGVDKHEGCGVTDDGVYAFKDGQYGHVFFCRIGKDAFRTEEDANIDVVKKLNAKLKSIDKQRAKIEKLRAKYQAKVEAKS